MTTQPQTDPHAAPIGTQTERVLHDFVRDAVSNLSEALKDSVPEFEDDIRWERGNDGHFRVHTRRMRNLGRTLSDEWLASLPDYQACVECLQADADVKPHLDRMVGTSTSTCRVEANGILKSLVYAMLDDEGRLAFTVEQFRGKWEKLIGFFGADQIPFKTVALLPHLVAPEFPLRLNNELVLDRLTEDEVTRCYQVGVIRPDSLLFPLIYGQVAVGIRRTVCLPKLIQRGDEPPEPPEAGGEGSFGNRPFSRGDLVIDDVLSALRLFKNTQIRAAGFAIWTDSPWLSGTSSYQVLRRWPYGGKFELSENDAPQFLDLWRLLEQGAARFTFSIHRFNLAFDRGLIADRIVDLVIAAEALFLSDLDDKYRGELRFRFALRAAKFVEHANYGEREIFRVMRQAYDARSAIVHGGSPKETALPDNPSASLPTFIDAIEELVRLALRKALSMKEEGKKVHQAEYWDSLVLSKPNP
jgi:Apea-like HEPN